MKPEAVYMEPSFYRDENYDPLDPCNAPNIRDAADVVVHRSGTFGFRVDKYQVTRPERGRVRIYDAAKMTDASEDRLCNLLYGRYCELRAIRIRSNGIVDYFGFH